MRVILTVDEARRFAQRQLMREHDETIEVDIAVPTQPPQSAFEGDVDTLLRVVHVLKNSGGYAQVKIACIKLIRVLVPGTSFGDAKWAVEVDREQALNYFNARKSFKGAYVPPVN